LSCGARVPLPLARPDKSTPWVMLVVLLVGIVAAGGGSALAQTFPNKPIKLVSGHAAGGISDTCARIIAPKLAELWGQPVVVETRAGAAGAIAAALVAKAPADGHTLLINTSSAIALLAVASTDFPFDPIRDFALVGRMANVPTVLAIRASIPATNVAAFVEYAKARPGQLTGGSSGNGSSSGFALEMLNAAAGLDILQVPYGGTAPAVMGLLSGQVDMVFAELSLVQPHVKSGAMRVLAPTGSRRLMALPDLPTIREQGLDGVAVDSFIGIAAPAGLPPATLAKLADGLTQVMRMPEVRQKFLQLGYDPVEDTPERYAAALREDVEKFALIARRIGMRNTK